MIDNNDLKTKCTVIKQVLQDSVRWVDTNIEEDKKTIVLSDLNKYRRHIDKYYKAIDKRPAIAIFGQSQVGKSYLVSNLAKTPEAYSLMVKVPGSGDEIDFIKNINPPGGGKEATGLVTRFTTADTFAQDWQPFELKIFSQVDIVNIITNGYLSNITHYTYTVDRDKIQKTLDKLSDIADKTTHPGFSEDDVYNLQEYLNKSFHDHFIIKDLNNLNFWDDLASVIPYIPADERWQLLEFLWGQQKFFTDLFNNLSEAIEKINFLNSVRVDLSALTPQSDTILDVERLRELYRDASMQKASVKIYDKDKFVTELNRSLLSAITAEVIMPLSDETAEHQQRQLLKDADILDFPGARSRQQIPENTFEEKNAEDKLLVFLRGKVAYLFDSYNDNFEISSLLFCMDDKQPEVTDLPQILYDWISKVHGDSPEKREERERELAKLVPNAGIDRIIPLLVVMTKFNIELQGNPATEQPGDLKPHNAKWDARISANFADQMSISIADKWIDKWNLQGAFKNIFPLRDPKWSKAIYEGFDSEGKETGIRPEYVQKLKDMEKSWINHPDVIKHFHNPLEAWQAVTELNKSGLDYIVKYLSPTCNPVIKKEQIKGQINQIAKNIKKLLGNFYRGGSIDEKLQKARINAAQTFMQIMKMQKERNTFGNLLNFLMLSESLAWKIFFDIMMKKQIAQNQATKQVEQNNAVPLDIIEMLSQFIDIKENDTAQDIINKLKEYFSIDDEQMLIDTMKISGINIEELLKSKETEETPQQQQDKSYIFAKKILTAWLTHINKLKEDIILQNIGINQTVAEHLIEELNRTKNRVNLKKVIAQSIDEHVKMFQLTNNIDIVAKVSANIVNKFVNTFGWAYEPAEKHPKVKTTDPQPIFAKTPVSSPEKSKLVLGIEFPGESLFVQWTAGMRASFEENVYYEENVKDQKQADADAKLGLIIKKIPD